MEELGYHFGDEAQTHLDRIRKERYALPDGEDGPKAVQEALKTGIREKQSKKK